MGLLRRDHSLLLSIMSRADVSFVVSVSRAGVAFRSRNGEGGAGGGNNLFQRQNRLGNVARNAEGVFAIKSAFITF